MVVKAPLEEKPPLPLVSAEGGQQPPFQHPVVSDRKLRISLLAGGPDLSIFLDLIHPFRQIRASLKIGNIPENIQGGLRYFFPCDSLKSLKFNFMIRFTSDSYSQTHPLLAENSVFVTNVYQFFWKLGVSFFVLFMALQVIAKEGLLFQ